MVPTPRRPAQGFADFLPLFDRMRLEYHDLFIEESL
jgi:hypothetical protein